MHSATKHVFEIKLGNIEGEKIDKFEKILLHLNSLLHLSGMCNLLLFKY
jgi:hypothetical protein